MTLEDDVESMLSEQFNASNESMFRVRGVGATTGIIQATNNAGGGGDSTFRCNDSMYDEDRGLISESEDGWAPDKDRADIANAENQIEDISEHSSDDVTDSGPDEPNAPKKAKKPKGEKKKKKKKKLEDGVVAGAPVVEEIKKPAAVVEKPIKKEENVETEPKKLVQMYKKL